MVRDEETHHNLNLDTVNLDIFAQLNFRADSL